MFLIVGLGNPGLKYTFTRHNTGFWVIDELAYRSGSQLREIICQSYVGRALLAGSRDAVLAKPLTYMNRSGLAVAALLRHFSLGPRELLVIYDDLDLPVSRIRLRSSGGGGGHKGLASIINALGSEEFARLRVGIAPAGEQGVGDAAGYVLSPFGAEEEQHIQEAVLLAADAVELFAAAGIEKAMNRYNAPPSGPSTE